MNEVGEGLVEASRPPQFDYDKFSLPNNVNLELFLAPHSSGLDLPDSEELRAIFLRSDIVIIEAEGADFTTEFAGLNSISQGDPEVFRYIQDRWVSKSTNPAWKEVFYGNLYGCCTAVTIVDLPLDHPLTVRRKQLVRESDQIAFFPDFDYAVTNYKDLHDRELKVLRKRDQRILQNLAPAIDAVVESNPELQVKRTQQPLKVFMVYGGNHVSLFDALSYKLRNTEDANFSVTADRRFDIQDFRTDVYSKFLRGEFTSRDDTARLLLIAFLEIAYDQLGIIDQRKIPLREVYGIINEAIDSLTYHDLQGLREDVLKQMRNLKKP